MKKLFLCLVAVLFAGSAMAQHVTNYNSKIASIFHGKPKTLIEISEGTGVCMTEFDESGRIILEKMDNHEYVFKYEWTADQIIMSAYDKEDRFVNQLVLEYKEEPGRLFVKSGNNDLLDFYFNENGTIHKVIATTANGASVLQFGYDTGHPFSWIRYSMIAGEKEVAGMAIETLMPDNQGNWTEVKSTDGQPFSARRKITYYE